MRLGRSQSQFKPDPRGGAHRRRRVRRVPCAPRSAPRSAIDLAMVSGRIAEHGDTLDVEGATVVVVDLDAGRADEMAALARLMARVGAWPPVIAVTQSFDENVARTLLQMRVADFLVKPVAPIDLVRACARVAKSPAGGAEPTEAQIYTFLPAVGGAGVTTLAMQTAMLLLNSGGPRVKPSTCLVDLEFPARRRRRLSRSRAAPQSGGNRAAAGPSRPAIARGHALVSRLRPRRGRRAEPAGGDALVRSRRGDAPARSRLHQFRLCRVRHAAHLVLLDRQRAARLEQVVHRQRDHGAQPAPRQAIGGGDQGAAGRRAQSAGHRQPLRAAHVLVRPAPQRPRADARRRLRRPRSPTITRWCARRSTAACRSTRSSPATRSPRSSRS